MQDQMRFVDNKGENGLPQVKIYLLIIEVPIKEHGEWAYPVFPTNFSIQGSPKTPYIWDTRCTFQKMLADQLIECLYGWN